MAKTGEILIVREAARREAFKEVGQLLELSLENAFVVITQTNEYTISPLTIRDIISQLRQGKLPEVSTEVRNC